MTDIISPMGCNSPVDIGGVHGGLVVAPISSMPDQLITVSGGLGVDMG